MSEQFFLTRADVENLKRVIRKVDGISGDGVVADQNHIRIIQRRPARTTQDQPFIPNCFAKVTGNATRPGVYTGRVWLLTQTMPDPTSSSSWSDTDIGKDPGSDNAYLWNTREATMTSGHILAAGTFPDLVPGMIFGRWTDGKFMVRIDECQ